MTEKNKIENVLGSAMNTFNAAAAPMSMSENFLRMTLEDKNDPLLGLNNFRP